MAALEVITYPDPLLREKAREIEDFNDSVKKLAEDMLDTMYAAPGIGLAANQVGSLLRLIVADLNPLDESKRHPLILANPEIIEAEGESLAEEGCLSIPGFTSNVKRYRWVKVSALDLKGSPLEIEAEDLLARVLQHEIDHLDGVLFIDRLSRIKRDLFRKKILKAARSTSS